MFKNKNKIRHLQTARNPPGRASPRRALLHGRQDSPVPGFRPLGSQHHRRRSHAGNASRPGQSHGRHRQPTHDPEARLGQPWWSVVRLQDELLLRLTGGRGGRRGPTTTSYPGSTAGQASVQSAESGA